MVCDERQCLPPEDIPFALAVSDVSATGRPDVCPPSQHLCHPEQAEEGEEVVQEEEEEEGLVGTFLLGFLLGLAALFTPCVFPMIPMTVSFFTKQSKNRADGIKNALLYGFFIIFIYTGLGLALTAFFGVDVLNVISTDPLFNVFLFALLLVFGFSFLGAFEPAPRAGRTRRTKPQTEEASWASSSWRPPWPSCLSPAPAHSWGQRWQGRPRARLPRQRRSCWAFRSRWRCRLASLPCSQDGSTVCPKVADG